jgi:hypothetical protein
VNRPASRLARVLSDSFGESQRLAGNYLEFDGQSINKRMSPQRAAREAGVAPPRKTLTTLAAGKRERLDLVSLPPSGSC